MGQIAHNTNLAVKGIIGIGAYSQIIAVKGDKPNAQKYLNIA
jgi:hypothetical protein